MCQIFSYSAIVYRRVAQSTSSQDGMLGKPFSSPLVASRYVSISTVNVWDDSNTYLEAPKKTNLGGLQN